MKLEGESEGTLFIKSWNDLEAGDILSANSGPVFVKYLQNLLATFSVLVILSPFSSTNGYVNFFIFILAYCIIQNPPRLLDVGLIYFNLILKIKPLGNSKKITLFLYGLYLRSFSLDR